MDECRRLVVYYLPPHACAPRVPAKETNPHTGDHGLAAAASTSSWVAAFAVYNNTISPSVPAMGFSTATSSSCADATVARGVWRSRPVRPSRKARSFMKTSIGRPLCCCSDCSTARQACLPRSAGWCLHGAEGLELLIAAIRPPVRLDAVMEGLGVRRTEDRPVRRGEVVPTSAGTPAAPSSTIHVRAIVPSRVVNQGSVGGALLPELPG